MANRCCRSFLRTILYLVLTWFALVVLYIIVPFPHPSDTNQDGLRKLNNGQVVTRVYRIEDFVLNQRRQFHDRSHVLLAFQWAADSSTLSFSPASSLPAIDKANVTLRDAPVGDTDGVSLPYFPEADAVILYWLTRNMGFQGPREYGQLTLTAQVKVTTSHQNLTAFSVFAADPDTLTPPLITLYLASDNHLVSVEFPPKCLTPSYTLQLRVLLIHIIAPLTLVGSVIITVTVGILKGIVGLATAFVFGWLVRGVYDRVLRPQPKEQDVEQVGADSLGKEGALGDVAAETNVKVDSDVCE